eukprot:scaffold17764_cov66-Phaeocystis_antarctica.AAC.7
MSNDGSALSSPVTACDFAEPSESCVPLNLSSKPLGSRVAAPPALLLPPQQQWRPTQKSTIAPASTRGASIRQPDAGDVDVEHLEDLQERRHRLGHGHLVHVAHTSGDLVEAEKLLSLGAERELRRQPRQPRQPTHQPGQRAYVAVWLKAPPQQYGGEGGDGDAPAEQHGPLRTTLARQARARPGIIVARRITHVASPAVWPLQPLLARALTEAHAAHAARAVA